MNFLDRFNIPFSNLGEGEHEFEFKIDDKFFEHFENSVVEHGDLEALITVVKKETLLELDFTIDGFVTVPCGLCLEDINLELTTYNELIVKFGAETGEESEDVIVLSTKEHHLNVAQFIYEFITLSVPMRNVHEDENGNSECDPEVLKEIEKYRIHEEEKKPDDHRWDGLKGINLN